MNKQQYLLLKLMEECNEVSQECSKSLIFGLEDINPKLEYVPNKERLRKEIHDVFAILEMLREFPTTNFQFDNNLVKQKIEKVNKYMEYSKTLNILKD